MAKKKFHPSVDKLLKLFLIVVLLIAGLKLFIANPWDKKEAEGDNKTSLTTREDFVKCLKESGLIMYGVNTCEYCQQQKKMFGSQFEELNFVNCEFERELCESKGITVYPIWEMGTKRAIGIQNFTQLSELANCPQP